ncbi:MAG: translation initiation factor IF-3 [Armatimonadota bacterium]
MDQDGEQIGIVSIDEARKYSKKTGLDVIEVAPDAKPPVCRLLDYGKFKYEQKKKQKEAQKKSKNVETKAIRVRPNTEQHDIDFKTRNALKFLKEGNKVQFHVIFRGPELRHKEIGKQQLIKFAKGCQDYANVAEPPHMEGRRMLMLLEPKPEEEQPDED